MGFKKTSPIVAAHAAVFVFLVMTLLLPACQNSNSQTVTADNRSPAPVAAREAIEELEQAAIIPFVVKITNKQTDSMLSAQTGSALFFSGIINNQVMELKGRFQDEEIVVYQGPSRLELKTDQDSKLLQKQQIGMISPLDHLDLVKNYTNQSYYGASPIFVDNVRYEHIVIKIPQEDIKNQLQQFLGLQFSDTMLLEEMAQSINVEYHLAVHPVSNSLKQCEVRVLSGAGERILEDQIFFRFLNG